MKEYELLSEYSYEDLQGYADTMFTTLSNKTYELLDVPRCRNAFKIIFDFIETKVRFDSLHRDSKGLLKYSAKGFSLNESTFETLDEVEHALKNKAFL